VTLADRAGLARVLGVGEGEAGSDLRLVLAAYDRWGPDAWARIQGDYSFALWDPKGPTLWIVRDSRGTRPAFWSLRGDTLAFGSSLTALRLALGGGGALDEAFLCEFLLFGSPADMSLTAFASIRRVPPGHAIRFRGGVVRSDQFASLMPDEAAVRLPAREVPGELNRRIEAAVGDRVRGRRAAVWMSGGMDSTSVAAAACAVLGPGAVTAHVAGLLREGADDPEPASAALAARHLGIPLRLHPLDDPDVLSERAAGTPEPVHTLHPSDEQARWRAQAADAPVALTGQGGDPGLTGSDLLGVGAGRALRLVRHLPSILAFAIAHGRLPPIGWRRREPPPAVTTPWLRADFARRTGADERRGAWMRPVAPPPPLARAEAWVRTVHPLWPWLFEDYEPDRTGVAVRTYHPLFDHRVMGFLLALPAIPWCADKQALRRAMEGRLPPGITKRPKTTPRWDPQLRSLIALPPSRREALAGLLDPLEPWVDVAAVRTAVLRPERLLSEEATREVGHEWSEAWGRPDACLGPGELRTPGTP
jgi:asparagine synthase (glutamine-hydrolysing)